MRLKIKIENFKELTFNLKNLIYLNILLKRVKKLFNNIQYFNIN